MDFTGAFRKMYDYIMEEDEHTESVVVLPEGSTCVKALEEKGIKVYQLPFVEIGYSFKRLFLYLPYLWMNAYRLKKIAQHEKIDILKSNDIYNLSLWVTKYIFRYNKPLVVHVRLLSTSYVSRLYWFWRWLHIRTADALIAVSYAAANDYFNHKKVTVVYGGAIQNEVYAPYEFSYDGTRSFKFLYLANFIRGKGNHFAIKAFKEVLKKNPNCTLTFVGGTFGVEANEKYLQEVKGIAYQYQIQNQVVFMGFASDVERIMKDHDCALNFSLSESFSMVSFDALRFGIPLISSDCGGPRELFQNKHSGLLVKNGAVKEMGVAMLKLSQDPELCRLFSYNSKEYIQDLYQRTPGYEKITEIYRQLYQN
jgi:glycosyltransferase involved in cell wall biosynthesis